MTPTPPTPVQPPSTLRPLRWLQAVLVLAVVLPLLLFLGAAAYLQRQAQAQAELQVDRAARIAQEHALKVFETSVALLQRADDLMAGDDEVDLLAREPQLHQELKRMAAGLPQLQGVFFLGGDGRMVATNRLLPAPKNIDFNDRDSFRHHKATPGEEVFISALLTSRATGEPFFDMSLRRSRRDGSFGGSLSASMTPDYFARFYAELAGGDTTLNLALLRADGSVLARWPDKPMASDASARRMAPAEFALPADGSAILTRRGVGPYPVQVVTWTPRAAVKATWWQQVRLLGALLLPLTLGLVAVAWVALRKTGESLRVVQRLREETQARQQVEEALRQAQKLEAMGRLTGGVAHDFNNLLTVVNNNLHLVRRLPPGTSFDGALAAMERAVKSGTNLTRQLLSFSRRQALRPEQISLPERMPQIVELLRPAVGGLITLSAEVDPATPPIEVDVAELELALLNLAINARDAMPEGGTLQVRVGAGAAPQSLAAAGGGAFVVVRMTDTGQGIAPALHDKVFEPFFTTKAPGQGTGLGLSQVYGFCARAGGTAALDSQEGRGTTVSLYFPACRSAGPVVPATPDPLAPQIQGARLLLVEDNDDVASSTTAMLQSMGCDVRRVATADAAQEHLRHHVDEVDVLLSDIVMPGALDGIELAHVLQGQHPDLPVLLMSGYSDSMTEAVRLRFEVLPKPCPPAALAHAIHGALARRPARTPAPA